MPIEIDCANCHATLTAPDAAAGRLVRCSHCQSPLRVPRPGEPPAAEEPANVQRMAIPVPLALPASKKQGFSATASDGKPAPATRMVNLVAYACYAVIAIALLNLASGLALELAVVTTASPNPTLPNPQHPPVIKAIWVTVVILFWLLSYGAVLLPYGLAGYGIQRRRGWARILCLVMAWISICLAVFIIGWLALAVAVTTLLADHPAPLQISPAVQHALNIANFGRNIILTVAYIVHATLSLSILFRSKYAAEFR